MPLSSLLLLYIWLFPIAPACTSTYTVLSGARSLYYSPSLGLYVPALVLPPSAYYFSWLRDPEAQWVWWTTSWTCDTVSIKDKFVLAQWAIDRLSSAILKVAADDYFRVVFNGVMLKDFGTVNYFTAYLSYNVSGLVRGASEAADQENELELIVESNCYAEGAIYRIEFTFL